MPPPAQIGLREGFVNYFTVVIKWSQRNKSSFWKICVAYNNLYRKILPVPPSSNASKMFEDNNIPNFEALLRK